MQNLELTVTDKQFKIEKQLIYYYMTIYFFVKDVFIFLWRLLKIWKSSRAAITFTIDSRNSSSLNWWENRMILSITGKTSFFARHHSQGVNLILSGSLISSTTSSSLDTSITSSAGLLCCTMISFSIFWLQKCRPHLLLASRKQYPFQNPHNHLGQAHQQVPSPN